MSRPIPNGPFGTATTNTAATPVVVSATLAPTAAGTPAPVVVQVAPATATKV